MSWVSLQDEVRLLLWALDTESASGVYNGTAPNPVTNAEFSRALARALGRPALMRVPKLALRLRFGAELAEVVAAGQRALPKRATEHGFEFEHETIDEALGALLGRR
jgi:NAD dependent epimerase/dehydratase family enzyme